MKNEIKLWKKIVACVLATVMLTYAPVEALARSGYNRSNILEGGTQMILRVDDDSDFSEKTESGVIYSHVETDVYSSDGMRVLIEAGTPACIEYTLEPNRSWGQAGRVCLTHATIRTVDNKHIPLRMGSCRKRWRMWEQQSEREYCRKQEQQPEREYWRMREQQPEQEHWRKRE